MNGCQVMVEHLEESPFTFPHLFSPPIHSWARHAGAQRAAVLPRDGGAL